MSARTGLAETAAARPDAREVDAAKVDDAKVDDTVGAVPTPTGIARPASADRPGDDASAALDAGVAARLRRDAAGLVPAVVQQWDTGEVLMVGYMDDEALHRTLTSGRATYWSRSRRQYWRKGDTSGHVQHVREVRLDCDGDALLVRVDQLGPACHTGERSCFDADRLPAVRPPAPAPATAP